MLPLSWRVEDLWRPVDHNRPFEKLLRLDVRDSAAAITISMSSQSPIALTAA
jgi:hypothetical protein